MIVNSFLQDLIDGDSKIKNKAYAFNANCWKAALAETFFQTGDTAMAIKVLEHPFMMNQKGESNALLQKNGYQLADITSKIRSSTEISKQFNPSILAKMLDPIESKSLPRFCMAIPVSKVDGAHSHAISIDFEKRLIFSPDVRHAFTLTQSNLDILVPGSDGCYGFHRVYSITETRKRTFSAL